MKQTTSPQRFFERAPVALAHVDRQGVITLANGAFARLAGRKASALEAEPFDAVLEGVGSDLAHALAAAAAAGRAMGATLLRADGTALPVEVRAERDGAVGGGFVVAVTPGLDADRARAEPSGEHAGGHDDLAGLIASGLAHHLNNHLTTVVTNAALLAPRIAQLPPDNGDFLTEITEAASHAAAMIRRLLAFSRRARTPLRPVALGPHLQRLAARLERDLPENITVECVDRLGGEVRADAASIDRIVGHLVANAREAMPGGGAIRITCEEVVHERHDGAPTSEVPAGRYVVMTVSDTGSGMDADAKSRLFEPFFTTKADDGRLGVGLPVVFGLVRRLGAHVTVESEVGVGTTVRLWLPADARATRREGGTRAAQPATREHPRKGRRAGAAPARAPEGRRAILLVEDEVPLRVAAQKVLERLGYSVYTAGDGERALRLFHSHEASVALVITDLMMPGLGGRGLYEALRAEGKSVPIVFTSGFVSSEMRELEGLDPAVPFLEKPWEVHELVRVVAELAGPPPAPPS